MNEIEAALAAQREACDRLLARVVHAAGEGDWAGLATRFREARDSIEREREIEARSLFPALEGVDPEVAAGIERVREARRVLAQTLAQLGAASPRHDAQGWRRTLDLVCAQLAQVRGVMRSGGLGRASERLAPALRQRIAAEIRGPDAGDAARPVLDLRGLEPPEPFLRILRQMSQQPAAPFQALLPREPLPLYEVLREHGFTWRGTAREDGSYALFIEPGSARRDAP